MSVSLMPSRRDFKTASQENVFEVSASIATSESAKSQLKGMDEACRGPPSEVPRCIRA